jgi:hypothetical protein
MQLLHKFKNLTRWALHHVRSFDFLVCKGRFSLKQKNASPKCFSLSEKAEDIQTSKSIIMHDRQRGAPSETGLIRELASRGGLAERTSKLTSSAVKTGGCPATGAFSLTWFTNTRPGVPVGGVRNVCSNSNR